MDDLLQQGITAYKAGKRDEARRIFITVVKQSPDSELAWGWMNNVCNTDQERIHCLKQVLRINPKNEKARQYLDQLLAPPFASELAISSILSNSGGPSPSEEQTRIKNSSFTQTQLFILLGLVVALFFLFAAAILFMFVKKDKVAIAASPTTFVASSANTTPLPTQILPTATMIPTYAYVPTWTPLPSPTSFVITARAPATSKPQPTQGNPAPANPPSANSNSNCSAALEYAAAVHQYNLDVIDYIHSPMIDYYKNLIDQATRDRDALALAQAQRGLDNEKAQVEAEKTTENKRYKAEQASINSKCQ
jgi:hypothetical protein